MNKIITISRTFGSGGREVGKRLADEIEFAYYDKQILKAISEETGLCSEYIEKYSETSLSRAFPISIGQSFINSFQMPSDTIQIAQTNIIRELSKKGDCVIVGRRADYILKDENIFKVFVYSSSMDERIDRCYKKTPSDKSKTREQMKKMISAIDKDRAKYYKYYSDQNWGDMNNYNLCIDTSVVDIKKAVKMIMLAINED